MKLASVKEGRVWVWDKGRSRVVEFERGSGELTRQYLWPGFGEASEVEIDESGGRLVVAMGEELLMVKLGE